MKSGMIWLIVALTPVAVALLAAAAVCSPLVVIYLMFTRTFDFIEDKAKRKAKLSQLIVKKPKQPDMFLELLKERCNDKVAS